MKVYTHFYLMDENTAIGFRWRTLLLHIPEHTRSHSGSL